VVVKGAGALKVALVAQKAGEGAEAGGGVGVVGPWRLVTNLGAVATGDVEAARGGVSDDAIVDALYLAFMFNLVIRAGEDAGTPRDPDRVALAGTVDRQWRNRSESFQGRPQIVEFLKRKWNRELDDRLIKELWAFTGSRIAVRFADEYHHDSGTWFRAYGNENWEFDDNGLMRQRHASINDLPIRAADREFHWDRRGPRPADHPGLTDLGR
jgi:nuclear transport factor 2 (NTF2) superfamily protein